MHDGILVVTGGSQAQDDDSDAGHGCPMDGGVSSISSGSACMLLNPNNNNSPILGIVIVMVIIAIKP